jgi:ubiquinone/menaquinone biosynthesis C-methylase UbiE
MNTKVNDRIIDAKDFNDTSYKKFGSLAQRRYPNEEFCRFMGRHFLDKNIPFSDRKNIKFLEVGCGVCANLWMVAKEGFDAYGIDFSQSAIDLGNSLCESYAVKPQLSVQDMCNLKFDDNYFEVVYDVFSSYSFNKVMGEKFLKETSRVLKKGGLFFSYFPSKMSEVYQYPQNASFTDENTLSSITRYNAPFSGTAHDFRFMHAQEYTDLLNKHGLKVQYLEENTRTYNNRTEKFGFIIIEAYKE